MIKVLVLIGVLFSLGSCRQSEKDSKSIIDKDEQIENDKSISELLEVKDTVQKVNEPLDKSTRYSMVFDDLPFERCNGDVVLYTKKSLDSLSLKVIDKFLYTFDDSCRINVEYSEFSNEVLFLVLEHDPSLIIKSLSQNNRLDTAYIMRNIGQPGNDASDLPKILRSVKSLEANGIIKNQLLEALKKAQSRYN